jgi:hypothetical protein
MSEAPKKPSPEYPAWLDGPRCTCGHIPSLHGYPPAGAWKTWKCFHADCGCEKYTPGGR